MNKLWSLFIILLVVFLTGCTSFPPLGVNRIRESIITSPEVTNELDGYRIAFVSDIHFGNNFSSERLETLIDTVNKTKPDCIILGGDLTLGKLQIPEFAKAASRFKATDGVYAVLGNHDFYNGRKDTITLLRNEGIVVLDETLIKTPNGLTIVGINDFRDIFPIMPKLDELIEVKTFTILISHNPDFVEKTDLTYFDLVLAGHTHGGQITVFGYAPRLPSAYGQKYRTGTVYKTGVPIIISNGAGFGGNLLRFRLGAPSDFLLLTLHSTDPK